MTVGAFAITAIICMHSKQAIFALHRGDRVEALKLLGAAEKVTSIGKPSSGCLQCG